MGVPEENVVPYVPGTNTSSSASHMLEWGCRMYQLSLLVSAPPASTMESRKSLPFTVAIAVEGVVPVLSTQVSDPPIP